MKLLKLDVKKSRKYGLFILFCLTGLVGCGVSVDVADSMCLAECRSALVDSWSGWAVFLGLIIGYVVGKE